MRKLLEFLRAVIVVSAIPAVLVFYAASSRTLLVALTAYLVIGVLGLLVINRVLQAKPSGEIQDN